MDMRSVSVPEIYKESQDFRFFMDWFVSALSKLQYDTENFLDLYDPLRCPEELLWLLADTMGFKYDDRLPASFNRLVLLYFMSMIRNRGSKDGVTLAAETNLAQFNILLKAGGGIDENGNKVAGSDILYNRLEDTSIPVNSVYVTPHTAEGYIDVVYFSTQIPVDACIEYVRPVGMFLFQHAGVRFDARTKIEVDARLTNSHDIGMSFGPAQVGHYRREDYARLQKAVPDSNGRQNPESHKRNEVWYRNSTYEDIANGNGSYGSGTAPLEEINPGYRALYSLQLSNNEEIVKSLIDPIFSLGYGPMDVGVTYPDDYIVKRKYNEVTGNFDKIYYTPYKDPVYPRKPAVNLRYDRELDESQTASAAGGKYDVMTVDSERSPDILNPRPAVNPIMGKMGEAISLNNQNTKYTQVMNDKITWKTVDKDTLTKSDSGDAYLD